MALRRPRVRRRLSLTSLIDVIFLLLLFFMLSSTFSRYQEIAFPFSGGAAELSTSDRHLLFLKPMQDYLLLNGRQVSIEALKDQLQAERQERDSILLISLGPEVSAQNLVDILGELRGLPDLPVSFVGGT